MIYFDYAATSINKPKEVIDAVVYAMNHFGNSGRSANKGSLDASRAVYEAREKIARFFNCDSARNVIFTANSTESLNIAIKGTLATGDHVITTDLEHNSVLRPLYALKREGVELSFVKADSNGNIDYSDFAKLKRENTKAVICTHASNLTGNMIDISVVGKFAKDNGLLFIVDASQTAGAFNIDMRQNNIDILCFTGHKSMLGPQGTGGMCVREGIEIRPLLHGGTGVQSYLKDQPKEMPVRLEAGTLNAHGIHGLSAAIDYINDTGIMNIQDKELALMNRFVDGIKNIDGIKIYGDFTRAHSPIVAFNWKDVDSTDIADALMDEYDIAVRAGAHCAPRMHEALGTVEQGAVRFSFGYENTIDEVDAAIEAIKELCQ